MRMTLTREMFIPTVAMFPDMVEIRDDQSSAVVYTYTNAKGQPVMKAFDGRKAKPTAFYRYNTVAERDKASNLFVQGIRGREQAVLNRRAESRAPHSLKVGDIMYCSWGHSMTLCDFYEVVAITPHGATVEQIGSKVVKGDAHAGNVVADATVRTGKISRHRVGADNIVKIESFAHAHLDDGRSHYVNRND